MTRFSGPPVCEGNWGNKFHAIRCYSALCGRNFDSRLECRRGEQLELANQSGAIQDLQYQVKFILCKEPRISIVIDFSYLEKGQRVYEDTKGKMTAECRVKLAWLKEKYGIEVKIVRREDL